MTDSKMTVDALRTQDKLRVEGASSTDLNKRSRLFLHHTRLVLEPKISLDLFYLTQPQFRSCFHYPALQLWHILLNMAGLQSSQSTSTACTPPITPPSSQLPPFSVPSLKRESRMTGDELAKALQLTTLDAPSGTHQTNTRSEAQGSNSVVGK
ncbi:uncharacterized protein PV09_09664 [Verruconis gallopava]|uniref:Uncharacterized protein n=1 Tax=Verruconis gallopava TaxID=253628 RepID=A0A0D1YCZ3_9PEZI|nr:uncharacterized protein PV09_09664 [Verruconis gallopava]KIV98526.1 hypothetical protein PV09_09664 [Verruconis gallopava]